MKARRQEKDVVFRWAHENGYSAVWIFPEIPVGYERLVYSVRKATIGLTRVARRAGTKQERAATSVRRPATTR